MEPQPSISGGVLKRPSQAWLMAVTCDVFRKFREYGSLPKKIDRVDKALNREFLPQAAVFRAL